MQTNTPFRKATELSIALVAISVFILAGCGGGSGTGTGNGGTGNGGTGSGGTGSVISLAPGSTVTAGTTGGGTLTTAQGYIDQLTGTGLHSVSRGMAASNGVPAIAAMAQSITATNNGDGTFSPLFTLKTLTAGSWVQTSSSGAGAANASSASPIYYLNGTTWVANPVLIETDVPNADGSVAYSYNNGWRAAATFASVDLSGVKLSTGAPLNISFNGGTSFTAYLGALGVTASFMDSNGSVVNATIPASATYPAGSVAWVKTSDATTQDWYYALTDTYNTATSPTAAVTTLLFADASAYTIASPLCVHNLAFVYASPQPAGLAANTARFDVYPAGTCAANPTGSNGTMDITYSAGPTHTLAIPSNYIPALPGTPSPVQGAAGQVFFLAPVAGGVYGGYMTPAGYQTVDPYSFPMLVRPMLNKTAMDAVMTAIGLPKF